MVTFGLKDDGYPEIDSNEFLELQMKAKFELDKLINGYVAIQRGNERTDHTKTQLRRDLLRSIKVLSNVHKDPETGGSLIYWDKMLEYARLAVAEFNKEDIQRGN